MNENLIACVAALVVSVVLLCVAAMALTGWILVRFSRETMRNMAQADERVSASWSFVERAVSRITAIHFPQSHARYRQLIGGPVADGAQQRPKQHWIDELDTAKRPPSAVNGGVGVPVLDLEPDEDLA